MKKFFLFAFIIIAATGLHFTAPPKDKINWISFDELAIKYAQNPKPILIDVYTDWCGWCKFMDKTTYRNQKLVKYINEKYYAVKFNAEDKRSFTFNNKKYAYNQHEKVNELAVYLTDGDLSFPNTVFLSSPSAAPAAISGYLKAGEIEAPIKYYGEKQNGVTTFEEFSRKMKKEF